MSKDIIRMAREAGVHVYPEFEKAFEHFAELVRADECRVIADLLEHGYTDDEGHHIQYAEEIRARSNK